FLRVAELIPASKDGTISGKSGQQILFELLSKAFTQHLSIIMGDAEEVSQHYRLMSRHTRDFFGIYSSLKLKPPSTHHYSAFQTHTPSMATLNLMFSDLEAGCCANTVEA
ncbi:hypothetical protein IGI04_006868, partial [Brassica rapa subsp. trilocularis]